MQRLHYKHKEVHQPIVISRNFSYDVSFSDIIDESHEVLKIRASSISSAVMFAIKSENLTIDDVKNIVVSKYGSYTILVPKDSKVKNYETRVKQLSRLYQVLPDKSIVELKTTAAQWLPFSKYRNIADPEERMKKVGLEIGLINRKLQDGRIKRNRYDK